MAAGREKVMPDWSSHKGRSHTWGRKLSTAERRESTAPLLDPPFVAPEEEELEAAHEEGHGSRGGGGHCRGDQDQATVEWKEERQPLDLMRPLLCGRE